MEPIGCSRGIQQVNVLGLEPIRSFSISCYKHRDETSGGRFLLALSRTVIDNWCFYPIVKCLQPSPTFTTFELQIQKSCETIVSFPQLRGRVEDTIEDRTRWLMESLTYNRAYAANAWVSKEVPSSSCLQRAFPCSGSLLRSYGSGV